MTSYNCINGSYAATITSLNTTLLRDEWGFDGFVATDREGDAGDALATLIPDKDLLMPGFEGQFVYIYKMLTDGVDNAYTNESELTTEYGNTAGMVDDLNNVAKENVKRILNGVLRSQSFADYNNMTYKNPYKSGDSLFVVTKGKITASK